MNAPAAVFRAAGEASAKPRTPGAVYVIANPALRQSKAWPYIRRELAGRIKGGRLAVWEDLFTDAPDYEARWQETVRDLAGAVVIPLKGDGRLVAGRVALGEVSAIRRAGRPVLLLLPDRRGLVPWEQVEVRPVKGDRVMGGELVVRGGAR